MPRVPWGKGSATFLQGGYAKTAVNRGTCPNHFFFLNVLKIRFSQPGRVKSIFHNTTQKQHSEALSNRLGDFWLTSMVGSQKAIFWGKSGISWLGRVKSIFLNIRQKRHFGALSNLQSDFEWILKFGSQKVILQGKSGFSELGRVKSKFEKMLEKLDSKPYYWIQLVGNDSEKPPR